MSQSGVLRRGTGFSESKAVEGILEKRLRISVVCWSCNESSEMKERGTEIHRDVSTLESWGPGDVVSQTCSLPADLLHSPTLPTAVLHLDGGGLSFYWGRL